MTDARAPSVRAAMISGDSVILVTVDGEILELATPKGTTSSVDTLDDRHRSRPATSARQATG